MRAPEQERKFFARGFNVSGTIAIGVNAYGVVAIGVNAGGSLLAIGMNAAAPIAFGAVNAVGIFSAAGVNALGAWALGNVLHMGSPVFAAASACIWFVATAVRQRRSAPPAADEPEPEPEPAAVPLREALERVHAWTRVTIEPRADGAFDLRDGEVVASVKSRVPLVRGKHFVQLRGERRPIGTTDYRHAETAMEHEVIAARALPKRVWWTLAHTRLAAAALLTVTMAALAFTQR